MAHYAFLDDNNIVVKVIAGVDEDEKSNLPKEFDSWEAFYEDQQGMKCVRTSYNTKENQHSNEEKTAFRGNYAGIGNEYDPDDFDNRAIFAEWLYFVSGRMSTPS